MIVSERVGGGFHSVVGETSGQDGAQFVRRTGQIAALYGCSCRTPYHVVAAYTLQMASDARGRGSYRSKDQEYAGEKETPES